MIYLYTNMYKVKKFEVHPDRPSKCSVRISEQTAIISVYDIK